MTKKRVNRKLAAKAMRNLNDQVEAMVQATGLPYSDFAYWLLYQTEVATGCLTHQETLESYPGEPVDEKMEDVLDNSHDAAIDDGGNFVSDHFDQMLRVGKAYDPEFRKLLAKRSDYAKLTTDTREHPTKE